MFPGWCSTSRSTPSSCLAVTLGLTLALAFTTETSRKNKPFDLGGRNHLGRHRRLSGLQLSPGRRDCMARRRGACRGAGLDLCGGAPRGRALARLGLHGGLARALRLHHRPLRGADLRTGDAAARRRSRQRNPDIPGSGGKPPHLRLGLRQHHPGDRGLRLYQPVPGRRFPDPLGQSRAHGRLRGPRRERHDRLDPSGRRADRHPVHDPRPGAGAHRRRGLLLRPRNVGDVALPRRRGEDRCRWLRAVRHDLRQRGVERARGRRRHHPGDEEVGLLGLSRGRDRVGRLDRRPAHAAGDGSLRLHHGGVPAGLVRHGLHRRRDPRDSLLRLPVHPRRSRGRQARHRRRRTRRGALARRDRQVRLALPGADPLPRHRTDLSRTYCC